MAVSLAGRTAIVTGAGSGINFHFARALLAKRCNVVLADLALRPEAEELVSNHQSSSRAPARAIFQKTDVQEWKQLENMFRAASEKLGGADIVCPGAGVYEPPFSNFWHPPSSPPSRDSTSSNTYASLSINLIHPIRTTQLAISHFLSSSPAVSAQNPKAVIHISSIAGQVTPLHAPIYNATKHGINGFVRSLAPLSERLGVRVTAVAPGVIKTPLWTENPEKLRLIKDGDAWVTPEYVADTMVSMIEDEEIEVSGAEGAIGSGAASEVAQGRRVVEQFNDPGPSGIGNTVSGLSIAEEEVWRDLKEGWGKL
ncbi:acyl-coA ligase [Physcia stellaris]|nr:acyl-coA ligase [Physcia stellaris]